VLVERLWPRGFTKERAAVDHWCKDVAPSHELRKWYGHDAERWEEFRRKYIAELEGSEAVRRLKGLTMRGDVTLIFSAREPSKSGAAVLLEVIQHVAES